MNTPVPWDPQIRHEKRFVALVTLLVISISTVPALLQCAFAAGRWTPLVGRNVIDYAVYLTWMRLAHDGIFYDVHLYSGVNPPGMMINPPYLLLGRLALLMGLPLPMAFHLGRLLLCILFVPICWWFIKLVIADAETRRLGLLLVCFSAGLGWLTPISVPEGSVDTWQVESTTFLSLYLYPHYIVSLTLLLGVYGNMILEERKNDWRHAVMSGLCLLGLALIHTYDLVSTAVICVLYLYVRASSWFRNRYGAIQPSTTKLAATMMLAAAMALPGLIYIVIHYLSDTVFAIKNHMLPSANPLYVAQGYGLLLILAAISIRGIFLSGEGDAESVAVKWGFRDFRSALFLCCWILGTLLSIYLPLSFQRRMMEGVHIPLALLAASAAIALLRRVADPARRRISKLALVAVLSLSLIRFMATDIEGYITNELNGSRTYLTLGEVRAVQWAGEHVSAKGCIQPIPWIVDNRTQTGIQDMALASYATVLTRRPVYAGHWNETADYDYKIQQLMLALTGHGNYEILKTTGVEYLIYSQKNDRSGITGKVLPCFAGKAPLPPYLTRVYSNADADVYQVTADASRVTAGASTTMAGASGGHRGP